MWEGEGGLAEVFGAGRLECSFEVAGIAAELCGKLSAVKLEVEVEGQWGKVELTKFCDNLMRLNLGGANGIQQQQG